MNYLENNQNKNNVPKYVWIAITVLIGYLIISSFMDTIEERRLTRKYEAVTDQFTKEMTQDMHAINKTLEKSINTLQDVPKIEIPKPTQNTPTLQPQNTQKNSNIKIEMH